MECEGLPREMGGDDFFGSATMSDTAGQWESKEILPQLRLAPEHFEALRRQGFVARERGRAGRDRYKLRFRCGGRQIVRYLGSDPAVAERLHSELARCQAAHRQLRQLRRLCRQAQRLLRETQSLLSPGLEQRGYRFHGRQIRRAMRSALACPRGDGHARTEQFFGMLRLLGEAQKDDGEIVR
jgi:hypothetical protein